MLPTGVFSSVTFNFVCFISSCDFYVIGVYFITPYLEEQKRKPQLTELYISSRYY